MGNSATRAKNKYQAANYDRHNLLIEKGRKEVYRAAADAAGESLTAYIIKAIEERMERDKKEQEG